ncbi:MAG TPA: T9SS type A sorting domain-containing protein [Bacteroidia bacterium]|nr:T9SS type A sorting domain-containing protein [Bacteroidia bacterium]HRB25611.1 T9SS type A sorting domain-containing protein [Bacteroidia bacterium]HRB86615.1 T9SS type A sorting domain-containing protein [Bacteroidia bacterium]HRC16386.1 T9SS type A sorting domain-containing protein [Bacteroidia bacterium]HRC35406.1 T9SS type A sorting domain-containing protein [Bacteroidia bacterium]
MKTITYCFAIIVFSCNMTFAQNCDLLCDGDFENPTVISSPHLVNYKTIECWKTTASDSILEFWDSGFNGVPSFSGNQFLEINANEVASIYQDVYLTAGDVITLHFAHRARVGIDTLGVSVSFQNNTPVILGYYADDDLVWGYYTEQYTVPATGQYRISFISVSNFYNVPTLGNFIDAVEVCLSPVGFDEVNLQETFLISSQKSTLKIDFTSQLKGEGILTVFDLQGKEVFRISVDNSRKQIATAPLNSGIYTVQLIQGRSITAKKVLIN